MKHSITILILILVVGVLGACVYRVLAQEMPPHDPTPQQLIALGDMEGPTSPSLPPTPPSEERPASIPLIIEKGFSSEGKVVHYMIPEDTVIRFQTRDSLTSTNWYYATVIRSKKRTGFFRIVIER